jgi:hypothetical protein
MNVPLKKYDVGFGRPPEHSKWKKGQCGNPNRIRKRTAKPVVAIIDGFFATQIEVIENGISRRRSVFETICLQLWNKAMAGNFRALKVVKMYSDFAASRDSTGGVIVEFVDDEASQKESEEKNG